MDQLERNQLGKKMKRYDELSESINNIASFIDLPNYVFNKYNGREECNIKLILSFGNGNTRETLTIREDNEVFQRIISELKILKEKYENQLEEL